MARYMRTDQTRRGEERREYGVWGLMELNAVIPAGRGTLHVHFTGGSVTGFGVVPAKFATSDPLVIHLIENSEYFRSGKIRRVINN